MSASKTEIVLADDHPVVRSGIHGFLSKEPDLIVVGEADSSQEAQRLAETLQPHILLLDLRMPGPSTAETVRFIGTHAPRTRVVVLTAYVDEAALYELVGLGVSGYVLKEDTPRTVIDAIRRAREGDTWFNPQVLAKLAQRTLPQVRPPGLTKRESEVLALVAKGWDNGRIARELQVEEQTVRNYLSRVYDKLGVNSRTEAALWLRDHHPDTG